MSSPHGRGESILKNRAAPFIVNARATIATTPSAESAIARSAARPGPVRLDERSGAGRSTFGPPARSAGGFQIGIVVRRTEVHEVPGLVASSMTRGRRGHRDRVRAPVTAYGFLDLVRALAHEREVVQGRRKVSV